MGAHGPGLPWAASACLATPQLNLALELLEAWRGGRQARRRGVRRVRLCAGPARLGSVHRGCEWCGGLRVKGPRPAKSELGFVPTLGYRSTFGPCAPALSARAAGAARLTANAASRAASRPIMSQDLLAPAEDLSSVCGDPAASVISSPARSDDTLNWDIEDLLHELASPPSMEVTAVAVTPKPNPACADAPKNPSPA